MTSAAGLKVHTAHVPIPEGDLTVGTIAQYGNAEGGQLDKSNARGDAIVGIGETCDRWAAEAKKKVEHKPFLKRVFG